MYYIHVSYIDRPAAIEYRCKTLKLALWFIKDASEWANFKKATLKYKR